MFLNYFYDNIVLIQLVVDNLDPQKHATAPLSLPNSNSSLP